MSLLCKMGLHRWHDATLHWQHPVTLMRATLGMDYCPFCNCLKGDHQHANTMSTVMHCRPTLVPLPA